MPSHAAFLNEILAHPEDDVPRLVYADWLDEQGDPLGEFIRVQCLLAKLPIDDDRRWSLETREELLRREFGDTWAESIRPFAKDWEFRRGFVERITIPGETFLEHAPEIFQAAPIQGVKLLHPEEQLSAFANSPWLQRLNSLDFSRSDLFWSEFEDLAWSPDLVNLKELNLKGTGLCNDQGLRMLSECEYLRNLTTLDLGDHRRDIVRIRDIRTFAETANFTKLTTLKLSGFGLRLVDSIAALVQTPLFGQLQRFDFYQDGNFDYAGSSHIVAVNRFFESSQVTNFSDLRLNCPLSLSTLHAILNSNHIQNLQLLSLENASLGTYISHVMEAPLHGLNHIKLASFSFSGSVVNNKTQAAVFESGRFQNLRELNLNRTGINRDGLISLVNSRFFARLRSLKLRRADGRMKAYYISQGSLEHMVESAAILQLQVLDLGSQPITDVTPLVDSSMAEHLCDLGLSKTNLDDSAIPRLCDAGAFPNLELVDLRGVKLNDESKAKLQKRFGAGVKLGSATRNKRKPQH